MASSIASVSFSISARPRLSQRGQAVPGLLGPNSVATSSSTKFPSLYSQPRRLRISCTAKPGTVDKVCEIVKKQLALAEDQVVTGESTFAALGADSLDTVEIVMGIEEAFGVSVEEQNAQKIATIQDAADMVEDLVTCNA